MEMSPRELSTGALAVTRPFRNGEKRSPAIAQGRLQCQSGSENREKERRERVRIQRECVREEDEEEKREEL
jgi:hypothetical protein